MNLTTNMIDPTKLSDVSKHYIGFLRTMEIDILHHLASASVDIADIDRRWLATAKTNIQLGFMAAYRALTEEG